MTAQGIIPRAFELENQWTPQYGTGAADERNLIGSYCKSWISLCVFLKLTITIADASPSQQFEVKVCEYPIKYKALS
jgi:hypothetical protein